MAIQSEVWTIYQVKRGVDSNYAGMQGVFVKARPERKIVYLRFLDGEEIPYGEHEVRKVGELTVTPALETCTQCGGEGRVRFQGVRCRCPKCNGCGQVQASAQVYQGPTMQDVRAVVREVGDVKTWNLGDRLVLKVTVTKWTAAVKRAKVTVMDYDGFEGHAAFALDGTQTDLEDAIKNARTELETTRAAVKRASGHAR